MKTSLIVLLFAFALQVSVEAQPGLRFGVQGGLNLNSPMLGGEYKDFLKGKMLIGWHLGGVVEIEILEELDLRTGLTLSQRGGKLQEDGDDYYIKSMPLYLEIPAYAIYRFESFYVGGGPNFGFGIGGNAKNSDGEKRSIDWGNDEDDFLSAFALGLGILGGTQIGPVEVGGTIQIDLTNSEPKYWRPDYKFRHFTFSVWAIYFFATGGGGAN